MTFSGSLYTRILLGFLANLLIILALILCFFLVQTHSNLKHLFAKTTSDKLSVAARVLSHRLSQTPLNEWGNLLEQHAVDFKTRFVVVLQDGSYYSSDENELPPLILTKGTDQLSKIHVKLSKQKDDYFRDDSSKGDGHDKRDRHEDRKDDRGQDEYFDSKRITLHTDKPKLHWFGISMRIARGHSRPNEPAMLFAVSTSRTGNGFAFNPYPSLIMVGLLVTISLLLWIPLIKKITTPLQKMANAAEEVAKGKFDVRVDAKRNDEIGRLAQTINHMIGRLEIFVNGQKRFMGDISHELGSPIARIQFGLAALEQRVEGNTRQRVKDISEDVTDMAELVSELLSFSRAETDMSKVVLKPTALLPLVQEVVRREERPGVTLHVDVDSQLVVSADDKLLKRALGNILRNSVMYAGTHGPISINAKILKDDIFIEIQDSGSGVETRFLDRLFEPFFRVDESRTMETGGVGLGLSIVKTCIRACNGSVTASNRDPSGLTVTIILNKSNTPAQHDVK